MLAAAAAAALALATHHPFDVDPACPEHVEEALHAGAAYLPRHLVHRDDRRIRVICHPASMPGGLGDGSTARPDFDPRRGELHVYRYEPFREERATYLLDALSPDARRRLWLMRMAVHAIVRRADARHGWSRAHAWRAANGWPPARSKRNVDPWGYSRARGMASPELDLATFAEEYFVRPEAVGARPPRDDGVECQELSKSRFLRRRGLVDRPRVRCPRLEAWMDLDRVDGVEIVLAEASSVHPESLFGHLMLRIVPRGRVGPTFDRYYQFMALHGNRMTPSEFMLRGFLGGFPTALLPSTLDAVVQRTVVGEHRSLRRHRLNLTRPQLRRLLERIWELERRHLYPYHFLTDNCGTFLADLVAFVTDRTTDELIPAGLAVTPAAVLDMMSSIPADPRRTHPDAPRLLEYLADDLLSPREEAMRARAEARRLDEDIRALLSPRHAAEYERRVRFEAVTDARVRKEAYVAWGTWIREIASQIGPEIGRRISRRVELQIRIEYLGFVVAEQRHRATVPEVILVRTLDDVLQTRRSLYKSEVSGAVRAERVRTLISKPARAPGAPSAREAYAVLTDLSAEMKMRFESDADPAAEAAQESARRAEEARVRHERSFLRGSPHRFGVGVGWIRDAGDDQLGLWLEASLLDDRLGTHGRHGVRPDTALVLGRLHVDFSPNADSGYVGTRLRLFEFASLRAAPATARVGWLDGFGWGTSLDVVHAVRDGGRFGSELNFLVYDLVAADDALERFAAVFGRTGARAGFAESGAEVGPTVGAGLLLRSSFGHHLANAIRLEAGVDLVTDVVEPSVRPEWRARLSARTPLDEDARGTVLLNPWVEATGGRTVAISVGLAIRN